MITFISFERIESRISSIMNAIRDVTLDWIILFDRLGIECHKNFFKLKRSLVGKSLR